MIQLNLLPDVKLEYIKARRTKRLVILASAIVTGTSVALVSMLLIATNVLQRTHLNNLNEDIENYSQKLKDIEGLNRILTVQNQLDSLDGLHAQKPAAGRLGKYLGQITPQDVNLAKLEVDFEDDIINIEGTAKNLRAVNQFIDTMKFTTYQAEGDTGDAFSDVRLASFDRSDEGQGSEEVPVTYEISLSFNPIIFDIATGVTLDVPDTVTTQSADRPDPDELFQLDSTTETEE